MRDEDYRREYLGQWPEEPDREEGHYQNEYITLRVITKIEDCALCPDSFICLSGKPLNQGKRIGPGFLCSRCACFHMWWGEQRLHIICDLLRRGTHAASTTPHASGTDHALVALYGPGADVNTGTYRREDMAGEAPCANPWHECDWIVPLHPMGDGHPKYFPYHSERLQQQQYTQPIDAYDCLHYFAGKMPKNLSNLTSREMLEPISPFQLRKQVVGHRVGTHGRRRLRGRYCL